MKIYPEIKGVEEKTKFYRFCASLTISGSQEWDVEDLTTRLNSLYPSGSLHDSHSKTLWQAARSNMDRILLPKRGRLQRIVYDHPIWALLVAIIGGTAVSFLTIFYIEPWHDSTKQKASPVIEESVQKASSPESLSASKVDKSSKEEAVPPKAETNNKSSNTDGDKAAAGS